MSRLDSFIRRLLAQRACIDEAAALIAAVPGPLLELGLGNGRTYDHLRERFPGRDIFVFDRELAAHPSSRPDLAHFIEGDFRATLPAALPRIRGKAALAHCDVGSHSREASRALAAAIAPLLAPLMAEGGIVLGDQPMPYPSWRELPLPD
ncbi:MAG: class I SAM-dependent methyltransferase, partial [Alphaproteobacteria bacterium]